MKYSPHEYQEYAKRFIIEHPEAAIFLDCGMGKTVITLTAIQELINDYFDVKRVLVIAPLRVGLTSWPAEIAKWDHLKNLRYSVAIGSTAKRIAALNDKTAQIVIINRENVDWLIKYNRFDFDMVVMDELSSFKSHKSKRFKALMSKRRTMKSCPNRNIKSVIKNLRRSFAVSIFQIKRNNRYKLLFIRF